jgi:hypothetical protein
MFELDVQKSRAREASNNFYLSAREASNNFLIIL